MDFIDPGSLDRFLRYYWLTHYDVVTQRRLYRTIKQHLEKTKTKADEFLRHLCDSALTYAVLLQPGFKDPEAATLRQLNEIGVTQHLPFLMAAKERLDDKAFSTAVTIVEALYVRYLLTGGLNPNVLEGNYSQWARDIRDGRSIVHVAGTARKFLMDHVKRPLKETLFGLDEVSVPQARYLLRKINEKLHGIREIDWSRATVEHIIPRKVTPHWEQETGKPAKELVAWTKRLGNVTLLDEGLNIGASNNPFGTKRNKYAESKFDLTRGLADMDKWTTDAVESREKQFAEVADQIWGI